jgi:outer membrane lipoprotein-sorting protein
VVWIDKNSLYSIKEKNYNKQAKQWMTTEFSDFRKVKGEWEMPYKMKTYMGDNLSFESETRSVKINTGLPDSLFNIEKAKKEAETKGGKMYDMNKGSMQGMGSMPEGMDMEKMKEMQKMMEKQYKRNGK